MCKDQVIYSFGGVNDLQAAVHEAQRADGGVGSSGLGNIGGGVLACEGTVFWDPGSYLLASPFHQSHREGRGRGRTSPLDNAASSMDCKHTHVLPQTPSFPFPPAPVHQAPFPSTRPCSAALACRCLAAPPCHIQLS